MLVPLGVIPDDGLPRNPAEEVQALSRKEEERMVYQLILYLSLGIAETSSENRHTQKESILYFFLFFIK